MTPGGGAPARRRAFVLAGGGSLGAVQAGMLRELIESGVTPDLIVGVSAGAINGAFLAHDPTLATVEHMLQVWSRVRTREALGLGWRVALGLLGLRNHLATADGLRRLLERELPFRRFDETRVPLHLVAADHETGDEVVLDEGEVIDAVLASTAIPGVFPPVVRGTRALIDGGVAANTPIATACLLGATELVVVPCGFTCVGTAVPRHPLGRAMHAITLLGARQLRQDYERHSARVPICIVPPLCPLAHSAYDYSCGAQLIALARASTRRWLDADGLRGVAFPGALDVHVHGEARG